jgi:hypothetical protein
VNLFEKVVIYSVRFFFQARKYDDLCGFWIQDILRLKLRRRRFNGNLFKFEAVILNSETFFKLFCTKFEHFRQALTFLAKNSTIM